MKSYSWKNIIYLHINTLVHIEWEKDRDCHKL